MTVLAFDLETVPDMDAGRRVFGFEGSDTEVAAAMIAKRWEETEGRTDFLKPAFHRIVGLGLAGLNSKMDAKGWAGPDECALIQRFLGAIERHPRLVTWNGNGFDLPVLRYRALIHGMDAHALYGPEGQKQWDSYSYRYGDQHVDLMDVLAGYGASAQLGLDEMARLMGLSGKTIARGDQVLALATAGDWDTIAAYVRSDAAQTLLLFLRWQVSRGRASEATYTEGKAFLDHSVAEDDALRAVT